MGNSRRCHTEGGLFSIIRFGFAIGEGRGRALIPIMFQQNELRDQRRIDIRKFVSDQRHEWRHNHLIFHAVTRDRRRVLVAPRRGISAPPPAEPR